MKQPAMSHDWFPRPLPANVEVGERSWLYSSFAFLHYRSRKPCGVRVGHDSGIYPGSFFNLGADGEVDIGNYCTLVGAIISCNTRVVIEDYAFIAHEVVLADHSVAVPPDVDTLLDTPKVTAPDKGIVLGENCWIGTRVTLLAGAKIGAGAIVGAGTTVATEVPPYAIVAGDPSRIVGWAKPSAART